MPRPPRAVPPLALRLVALALALVALSLVAVAGAAGAVGPFAVWRSPGPAPLRVEIRIHYSHFEPSRLFVPAGVPVTFVIHNDDPIDHEWIVGDDALQQRHRTGTEMRHDSRPTEITIAALSTLETTITFAQPVVWRYICHLPGHEAYGMVGTLVVR
jgi:uncharacterized cupredoxin-like copper-binding protein